MSMHEERREFLRIPVTTKVKFTDGNQEQILFTDDLSEGGLFLKSDNPPFKGTVLDLEISIPNVDQLIQLKGEVAWRQEGRGCGVRFVRITQAQKKLIKGFIEASKPSS
jgi:type IV pilus assembly protein PilZ